MSDEESDADSIGPDIDLEKLRSDRVEDPESVDLDVEDVAGEEAVQASEHDDHHDEHAHDEPEGRTTAPQSEYTMRQVAIGALVTVVGLVVTIGVPAALA